MCSSPKRRPKSLCWLLRQLLIAEEDHQVLHQRVVHLLELLVAQRPGEVDAENLRTDDGRELAHLDRLVGHRHFLLAFCRSLREKVGMGDTLVLRPATIAMHPFWRQRSPRLSSNTAASSCRIRCLSRNRGRHRRRTEEGRRRHHRGAKRRHPRLRQ
jgi:hypothetical protein